MIHTIKFNTENEADVEALQNVLQAEDMRLALWDIANEIFRPARKHGYADPTLSSLLEKNEEASEIISLLEEKFYAILGERDIKL